MVPILLTAGHISRPGAHYLSMGAPDKTAILLSGRFWGSEFLLSARESSWQAEFIICLSWTLTACLFFIFCLSLSVSMRESVSRDRDRRGGKEKRRRIRERDKWGLTVYSRIILWVQPLVKELPTYPFLGFYSWDVTARQRIERRQIPRKGKVNQSSDTQSQ